MVCQYLGVSMRGVHGVSKITTAADFWSFGISIICSSVLGTNNLRRDLRNGLTSDFFSNEKMRTCNSKLLDLICRLTVCFNFYMTLLYLTCNSLLYSTCNSHVDFK